MPNQCERGLPIGQRTTHDEVIVAVHENSHHGAAHALQARIGNRVADREMVHHLSLLGRHVEIAMHFLIVERADAGGAQPERFRGKIQAVADGAGFEMHIAITTVAVSAGGTIEIADHRKRHAGVPGEILPEAQARGRDALVATFD